MTAASAAKDFPAIAVQAYRGFDQWTRNHHGVAGYRQLARDLIEETALAINFVNSAIPTRVIVGKTELTEVYGFHVLLEVKDRDTGELSEIDLRWDLPDFMPSREAAIEWIYDSVRFAWTHELNEAMHLDGKRRRDLHDSAGRAMPTPEDRKLGWGDGSTVLDRPPLQ